MRGEYRHNFSDLDRFIKRLDEERRKTQDVEIRKWLPLISKAKARLQKYPDTFAYHIRTCERMRQYLLRNRFFPDSFQKMLTSFEFDLDLMKRGK